MTEWMNSWPPCLFCLVCAIAYRCFYSCCCSFRFDYIALHSNHAPNQADNLDKIVLKAMGRAINKAVTIAEILKRKMPLHQCNSLSSVEMIDIFEPLEEGLDRVTSRRYGT